MKLSIDELEKFGFSIDRMGAVYRYQDRILRVINNENELLTRKLFECGLIDALVSAELFVDTWISDAQVEGFNLVVEHKLISPWNYPYEWSFFMLKDAATTCLNIAEICKDYGCEIFDVHPYNIVFDMSKPKFIDLGSIISKSEKDENLWPGYLNFYNTFYVPLFLYSDGYNNLTSCYQMFPGYHDEKDIYKLVHKHSGVFGVYASNLRCKIIYNFVKITTTRYFRIVDRFSNNKHLNLILLIKRTFQNIFTIRKSRRMINRLDSNKLKTTWQDYHAQLDPGHDSRFQRVTEIINTSLHDAETVVELASNQGKFANHLLNNTQIKRVYATDYDRKAVDSIYTNNKGSEKLLPLVYDFVRPNGRIGDSVAGERLKSDIVIALAVTHHLILSQGIDLFQIIEILQHLTTKYVVVEFMPLGLYNGDKSKTPPIPDYYTLSWFRESFESNFKIVHDEELSLNRHLFVGELKVES